MMVLYLTEQQTTKYRPDGSGHAGFVLQGARIERLACFEADKRENTVLQYRLGLAGALIQRHDLVELDQAVGLAIRNVV